jgi:exonuclease SbcD
MGRRAVKILHFADAHIDMANYGRHDPVTGLPLRVLDFLKSLDTIVDTAIEEQVDLVIFAGDAYKDRTPAPTFQREWGKRIMRLSAAKIPTILLVGNHDLSPSIGRAHAIQEFDTLQVPYVHVISKPGFLGPDELGFPAQVLGLPWVSRSGLMASLASRDEQSDNILEDIEGLLSQFLAGKIESADPSLPLILTAHASIQGAKLGYERTIMLGADLVLPASLVKDPRLDYVALGHIHKPQDLNENQHPPVIYPGSIERVDFGEAADDKFFVTADVQRGKTQVFWKKLTGTRRFIDRYLKLDNPENVTARIKSALPPAPDMESAIVRLVIDYPRDYEKLIDEAELRSHTAGAFELHLIKRPQTEARVRIPGDQPVASMQPAQLLELYWDTVKTNPAERDALSKIAAQILADDPPPANLT